MLIIRRKGGKIGIRNKNTISCFYFRNLLFYVRKNRN
nr:MAG TPA: hypothetical protein [Caudoviricetes sp.]